MREGIKGNCNCAASNGELWYWEILVFRRSMREDYLLILLDALFAGEPRYDMIGWRRRSVTCESGGGITLVLVWNTVFRIRNMYLLLLLLLEYGNISYILVIS